MTVKHNNNDGACHLTIGGRGSIVVLERRHGTFKAVPLPAGAVSGRDDARKPMLIGLDGRGALLLDPAIKTISTVAQLPADAVPTYAYGDTATGTYWMVSDGDKDGNDALNCGGHGSLVTVIACGGGTAPAAPLKMICAGRGHHVMAYTAPSAAAPDVPRRAFASNLIEGSITVIGNDPADASTYLKIITTLNLCDPSREDGMHDRLPNNAFPHGMVYSAATGKIYNLNNGYGSVVVIDPRSNTIEASYKMPVSSNLLLSPNGRFLIGKGVDRKTDPDHLLGRLTVMDATTGEIAANVELADVYPSVYRFNRDGSKLYVSTAATGKGQQKANSKLAALLVFDSSALPALKLVKEVAVGTADCGRRPFAFYDQDGAQSVLIPNPSDGTLSILDGSNDTVVDTITLNSEPIDEVNFMYWRSALHGA